MTERDTVRSGQTVRFACFVLLPIFAASARADDAALRERVMRELPDAWSRLEKLYSELSGTGKVTVYSGPPLGEAAAAASPAERRKMITTPVSPADEVITSTDTVAFAISGSMRKYEEDTSLKRLFDRETSSFRVAQKDPLFNHRHLHAIGPSSWFILNWDDRNPGRPFVKSLGSNRSREMELSLQSSLRTIRAPFGEFLAVNLREVLRSSSTDLDISGVKIDGCDDILIVASYDRFQYYSIPAEWKIPKPSRSIKSPTWLVVSPDLGWAVREIGMGESKNASTMWMELSYEGLHGELPILRRSVMHELQVRRRTVLDIDQLHFGPIPEREFTLAAYGLPDLDKPAGTSSRWSLGFIWFGAALATLCVALGLKWYSNRLRNVRRAA